MARKWMLGILLLTFSVVAFAQQGAKISDFQWMAGNWTANVDGKSADRNCSQVAGGSMMCMTRIIAENEAIWLEFSVLRATSNGIVLDTRFFSGDAQPAPPVSNELRLKTTAANVWTFESSTGNQPKTVTMTRDGSWSMAVHADMIDADGKSSSIDAKWQKAR